MSAFECNVTPTRIRNARKRNEDREPTIVDLRPFTGKCIVTFEDIPLTKIARRIVTVLNPFTETLKVTIVKKPKPEFNVSFEWTSHEIASEGSVNLEVLWSPLKVVSCREVIEISDQFGNKKTVALILKSCELKKTIMRKTGGTDFNKKLKLKAPVTNVAMNRPKTVPISNSNCDEFSENYTAQGILPISMSPKRKILTINTTKSPLRNATNIQNNEDDSSLSKNQTPINTNALAIFDNIKFTPLTETKPKCESKLEYLTSLPTPIMSKRDDITLPKDILGRKNILQEMITPELITQQITEITRNEIYRPSKLDLEQEVQQIEDREHQTYIKLPSSEEINEIELVLTSNKNAIISKSQSLSTPPHQTELQKTFHVNKSLSFNENIVSDTFDCNRRLLSESMQNVESPAILEKEKLKKCIQGSMPNLNEICESNFEHNRYFNHQQSQPHIEMRAQNLSIESIVSNTDFKEIETCAQSSRLNLNEIGRPRKSSSPINPEMVILESPFKTQNNSQQYKKSKKSPTKFYLSPTIQRIREEEQEPSSPTAAKKLLTFSPPKSKISEINDIYRRETFVISKKGESRVTTWKQQQNQHMFAIPKVPRESIFRTTIASTISQSLTSLSSSITSIASTSSMPVTSGRLYNENFINAYSQKDPFSASTTEDPFLSSSMYLDEHTLDGIEKSFKKWLNALVTIPPDLETDRNEKIDVAKIFNEVQNKEISLPPTKETVCSQYYTARLDQLRSAAIRFFHSDIISKPLNKLSVIINEKKLLEVHSARSIHLDLVLQRSLLELLLCFNPLWLRIGLEVVFNVQLNLSSNQDIFGMCKFICTHMFRSQYLQQKYSKYHQQQELLDKLKKHTAKNFLFLIFFLDRAKETRLIKQNPCLFIKAAPYKETTEILKKFASLVLANYGDIIRMMKRIDYVLTHKQTVIDEFDFAFKNLAVDLRDGVRLTKVMEVILLRDDLVNKVRVPAISRLQKVHNVELAMKALESAEYKIIGNITSKDIADGHREKTLSLLWQIIYKFRAPRFNAAAKIIQKFWRNKWLKIVIEKRIKLKAEQKLNNAAIVIQKNFRGWKSRKLVKEYRERVIKAVVILQKYALIYLERKKGKVLMNQERMRFIKLKELVPKIQNRFRAKLIMRAIQKDYLHKRNAIIKIQKYWRSVIQMRQQREHFLKTKAAKLIQERFRYKLKMRQVRNDYLEKRSNIIKIQQLWRATLKMRKQRLDYQSTIRSIILIQRRFRANQAMKTAVINYQKKKSAIILIQKWYRSHRETLKIRNEFLLVKKTVLQVENRIIANRLMMNERNNFMKLREVSIFVQRRYRSKIETRRLQKHFQESKLMIVKIQCHIRGYLARKRFKVIKLNNAAITIQKNFRGWKSRKLVKEYRERVIKAVVILQKYALIYLERKKGKVLMNQERMRFIKLKELVPKIQNRFRAKLIMRAIQKDYLHKRNAIIKIQKYWRSVIQMRQQRQNFLKTRIVIQSIQERFRYKLKMRQVRNDYLEKRSKIIKIQQLWRATLKMRKQRLDYQSTIRSIILIQRRFRANQAMKTAVINYQKNKSAIILIQKWYRSHRETLKIRNEFLLVKKTVLQVENRIIANRLMLNERSNFMKLREVSIFVQRRYRSKIETRRLQKHFQESKLMIVKIQCHIRGYLARKRFKELQTPENIEKRRRHKAARTIQAAWRGFKERSKKSNMCFRVIVNRLIKVSRNVDPTQTLAAKLKISIDFLKYRYDSNVAISTLAKLEYMSRTVPWILIDDAEFISVFCYGIMAQAIRSEIDKQIIELCSCIILNLGRYSGTKEDAFQENGLITIAQMLLRWCDKDCGIFNTLCTLIWVFSHCDIKKMIIRKFMTMKDGEFIMGQIKQNVLRKENMRKNSRRPIGFQSISLVKYKKDYQLQMRHQPQTVYSTGFITPEMLKQCRQFPSLEPDYGVVRMHPYIFYSSVFAFDMVLSKLNIIIFK